MLSHSQLHYDYNCNHFIFIIKIVSIFLLFLCVPLRCLVCLPFRCLLFTGALVFTAVSKDDTRDGVVFKCHAYNYVMRLTSGGSYFRILVDDGK